MIKAIVFDFGGVITTEGFYIWIGKIGLDLSSSQKAYFQELADKVDRGDISNKELVKILAQKCGVKENEVWKGIKKEIVFNVELLDRIKSLHANYKTGILSNYTHEWLEELIEENQLKAYFDHIIISSRYKVIKPDPKIYKIMLDQFKLKPHEVLFIDDRDYQVEGAKKLGINALLYTKFDKLIKDLKDYGVKA